MILFAQILYLWNYLGDASGGKGMEVEILGTFMLEMGIRQEIK